MNREMLEMVEVLAQEKNVPREVVFGVLETALASAVKKANFAGEDADIEVHVDRETGDYQAWRRWLVVADDQGLQEPDRQEMYSDIHDEYPELNVGDYIDFAALARCRTRTNARGIPGSRRKSGFRLSQAHGQG